MFNLIVSYNGWDSSPKIISRNRIGEFTNDIIVERFKLKERVDVDAISKLPTLFVAETQRSGDQLARVGTITQLRLSGSDCHIEYEFDSAIPAISNKTLEEIAQKLEINSYEFTRTHWALKDVDLFKVLLRNDATKRPVPKIFRLSDKSVDDNLVSVMMPFRPTFDGVYAALNSAAVGLGKRCNRADNNWVHDIIIQDIVSMICESRVVICDLSGENANVFYEMGIAHCLGKDVILINQEGGKVPFDVQHLRYISYLNNGEGLRVLKDEVSKRILAFEKS